jgi:hypothetical protein
VIGISEGIVLADRYRLTRRQSERETGASWIAVDLETGSDVWVQFADHGGLARAAEVVRGLAGTSSHAAALPAVLDTGELRMIVDSRALAALRGGEQAHATHVEIVIEFVVVKPLAGRGLPAKIQRKALPPAEALRIAAALAGALGAALAAGGSHGWIGSGSVWLVRSGGCVLDLALGLAYPDGSAIELEQQVTGYFAPERFAVSDQAHAAVGSGSKATEAADVFALGWMVYEMLIGHAQLVAEYERLVAGAGAVTTLELLALWRARARTHVTELVEADSALAVLVLACLAENPAERPGFADFGERARGLAKALAGVAPLVVPVGRTRRAELEAVEAVELADAADAAAAADAAVADAAVEDVAVADTADVAAAAVAVAAIGAGVLASEALAGEALAARGMESTETAQVAAAAGVAGGGVTGAAASEEAGSAAAMGTGGGVSASEEAASAVVAEAETVVLAAAAAGSGSRSNSDSGSNSGPGSGGAAESAKELERLSHRARLATIGGTAAAVVALGVGIAAGYSIGHSGNHGTTMLTAAGTNAAGPLPSATSSLVAAPAPTVTVTVTVTVSEAAAPVPSASASAAASTSAGASSGTAGGASPTAVASPALPAPSSSAEAITELDQEIQYIWSTGQISSATRQRLTTAVSKLKSSLGTSSSSSSLSGLTTLIRSLAGSGNLPSGAELALESILGYFYAGSGS